MPNLRLYIPSSLLTAPNPTNEITTLELSYDPRVLWADVYEGFPTVVSLACYVEGSPKPLTIHIDPDTILALAAKLTRKD